MVPLLSSESKISVGLYNLKSSSAEETKAKCDSS